MISDNFLTHSLSWSMFRAMCKMILHTPGALYVCLSRFVLKGVRKRENILSCHCSRKNWPKGRSALTLGQVTVGNIGSNLVLWVLVVCLLIFFLKFPEMTQVLCFLDLS